MPTDIMNKVKCPLARPTAEIESQIATSYYIAVVFVVNTKPKSI